MIFAWKMPEFYIIIALKIFSRILGGGGGGYMLTPPPVSYAYVSLASAVIMTYSDCESWPGSRRHKCRKAPAGCWLPTFTPIKLTDLRSWAIIPQLPQGYNLSSSERHGMMGLCLKGWSVMVTPSAVTSIVLGLKYKCFTVLNCTSFPR